MKTNHRRGFVAGAHRHQGMFSTAATDSLSDRSFKASIGNDSSNGNRGMAGAKAGAKKYIRTRIRYHQKAATKKLAIEETS